MYVKRAVAVGDAHRLSPKVLAAVDPQVFWAAILRSKKFIRTINAAASDATVGTRVHGILAAVAKEWSSVGEGVKCMRKSAQLGTFSSSVEPDERKWDLSTENSHRELAEMSATAATCCILATYPENVVFGQ